MAELVSTEIYPDVSEPRWHRAMDDLLPALRALPPAPKDVGRLAGIVRRPAPGAREMLEHTLLSIADGVPGDEWGRRPNRSPDGQLAVINVAIAELIANGQPLEVFGDNLFVDLDISAQNLPVTSRIKVGKAIVEVTPMPHNGCRKFNGRFGEAALRLVQAPETRSQNYRGIYWKVIEPGTIRLGDALQVLSRPTPAR